MKHSSANPMVNRRRFLRAGVLTGSAAFGLPCFVPASALSRSGRVGANNRIALGFIGVGNMGTGHVRTFLRHQDVRVVGVCDVRDRHARRAKEMVDAHYGDQACTVQRDFRALLAGAEIDAVVIAVPDHWHVLVGREAARQGKDMYFEKPVGVSIAEGKALRTAVQRYGVVFQFVHMDMPTAIRRAPQFRLTNFGILFRGTEGWIYITRQGFFTNPQNLKHATIGPHEIHLPRSNDHRRNFLEAVKARSKPITDVDTAVRSDTICHQADIAMRLERPLVWDPI